jgi:hypothetical protein
MANDEFTEDLEDEVDEPDLDEDLEEEDLEEGDDDLIDDDLIDDDDLIEDEEEEEDEEPAATTTEAPPSEEEEEEEEELDPDDVEADLDSILKERLVVVEVVEDETPDPEDGAEGTKVRPRAPGEFVCQSCFLVKHPSQLADEKRMLCRDCV